MFLSVAVAFAFGTAANAASGLGGGPGFPDRAEFPFVAGVESSVTSGFLVQNLGPAPLELGISHDAPRGVLIEPTEGQETIYQPGEARDFFFDVIVTEPVLPGTYPININIREEDPIDPEESGSFYIPAISGEIILEVVGASATAKLSTVSALTGAPATGDLALFYIGSSGSEIQINEANAAILETDLVPGNYKFTFSVPGLQRQDFNFSISENEVLDLVYEIPTLEFLGVGAVPTRDERGYIQAVELSMDIFNNLQLLEEQVFFQANISRDGERIDEFVIGALPDLPRERTNLSGNYIRDEGFAQGDWSFEFQIVGETFEVTSDQIAFVNSPGIFQSYLQEIVIALGALIILALLLPKRWWTFIFQKFRREKTLEVQPTNQVSVTQFKEQRPQNVQEPVRQPSFSETRKSENQPRVETEKDVNKYQLTGLAKSILAKVAKSSEQKKQEEERGKQERPAETGPLRSTWPSEPAKSNKQARIVREDKPDRSHEKSDKAVDKTSLKRAIAIRRELKQLEADGVKSLALSYQIDSVFVNEGETVIRRSNGNPYSSEEVESIERLTSLEQNLQKIETPAIKAEAIRVLVKEEIGTSGSARNF